jgi:amidophosphoribosyltransferase
MCGIVGVSLGNPELSCTSDLVEAALLLQHRGQDACGIVCGSENGTISSHKGYGLVTEVLCPETQIANELQGSFGIGHGTRS